MIECSECGCPYDESRANCPECGNPTPRAVGKPVSQNCPNCGAPLTGAEKCEYCGSVIPREKPAETYRPREIYIAPRPVEPQPAPSQKKSDNSGVVAGAAFLGGLLGGLLDDD